MKKLLCLIFLFLCFYVGNSNAIYFDKVIGIKNQWDYGNNPSEEEVRTAFEALKHIYDTDKVLDPKDCYYAAVIIASIDQLRLAAIAQKIYETRKIDIFKQFEFPKFQHNLFIEGAKQIKEGSLKWDKEEAYKNLLNDPLLFNPSLNNYKKMNQLGKGTLIFLEKNKLLVPYSVIRNLLALGLPVVMIAGVIYFIRRNPQHPLVRNYLLPLIHQARQNSLWALSELRRFCIRWYYRRR